MKTILFSIVSIILSLTLVLTIIGFHVKTEDLEKVHASEISSLEESLSAEMESLAEEIRAIKTQGESLFREIRYEYKDPDPETGKAKLHITAYPKDVSAAMTVEVGLEGTAMIEMNRSEGQFFATLSVDLFEDGGAVYLHVRGEDVATGLEKTDITADDVWSRFLPMPPMKFSGITDTKPKIVDGNISFYGYFYPAVSRYPVYDTVGDIENVIVYIKKNGEIMERIYENGGDQTHGCEISYGDIVTLVARVTDSYGFTAEYLFGQYGYDEEWGLVPYGVTCEYGSYQNVTVWGSADIPLYEAEHLYSFYKK